MPFDARRFIASEADIRDDEWSEAGGGATYDAALDAEQDAADRAAERADAGGRRG